MYNTSLELNFKCEIDQEYNISSLELWFDMGNKIYSIDQSRLSENYLNYVIEDIKVFFEDEINSGGISADGWTKIVYQDKYEADIDLEIDIDENFVDEFGHWFNYRVYWFDMELPVLLLTHEKERIKGYVNG